MTSWAGSWSRYRWIDETGALHTVQVIHEWDEEAVETRCASFVHNEACRQSSKQGLRRTMRGAATGSGLVIQRTLVVQARA